MDDSDTSSLSSVAPDEEVQKLAPIFLKAKRATKKVAPPPVASPPRPKREPSPPHEDAFADNPDVAVSSNHISTPWRVEDAQTRDVARMLIVCLSVHRHVQITILGRLSTKASTLWTTRHRKSSVRASPNTSSGGVALCIARTCPEPQETSRVSQVWLDRGIVLTHIRQGHHGRALEEAISSHKSQWPNKWQGRNPLSGSSEFTSMSAEERVCHSRKDESHADMSQLYLLRTLIMWSLTSSEDISTLIKDSYKQNRHNDDENQPLSVQPWGRDGDKRRYFLIEGQDDTSFRVYREGHRLDKKVQWYSMAGDIEEVKALASRLETTDGTQAARTMSARMLAAVPRFEATEEVSTRFPSTSISTDIL